jgi:two-component system KDP operon response regulator KdpE
LAKGEEEGIFSVGELMVDMIHRRITVSGAEVHLTPIEYRLLTVLVKHAGKVLTHQFLLKEVWGPNYVERAHYLRIYMGTLRHKLEKDPARPRFLLTEVGVGYRLAVV